MYCKKCGFEVEKGWKYCPKCKTNLEDGNMEPNKKVIMEKLESEKKNSWIYLCIFLINIIAMFISQDLRGLFFVGALISISTGSLKCPNSKILQFVFCLFAIAVVLYILAIIFMLFTCIHTINTWDCSGIG